MPVHQVIASWQHYGLPLQDWLLQAASLAPDRSTPLVTKSTSPRKVPIPNFTTALKSEIARISRKEIKTEIERLQATVSQKRKDIAALKRHLAALERLANQTMKKVVKVSPQQVSAPKVTGPKIRFSPARLAAHRQKLGLSNILALQVRRL